MLNNYSEKIVDIFYMLPLVLLLSVVYISFNPNPAGEIANEVVSESLSRGTIIRQMALLIGAFISVLLIKGQKIPKSFYKLMFIFGIFILTTFWSIAPEYTIKRAIRFLCLSLIVLPLSISNQRFNQALKTILLFSVVICVVSLMMYFQGFGITSMGDELRLQGITPQPNALGPLALMGIIILFFFRKQSGIYFYGLLTILVATLVLTKSRSTYIALFAFLAVAIGIKGPNESFLVKTGLFLLIVFITCAIGFFGVSEFGGRDLSFSGRTIIWELTIEDWTAHPFLGSGYGASFVPVKGSLFENVLHKLGWATTHSHHEVLQLFNELGLFFAPIVILILFIGIEYRSRIGLYILVPLIVFILSETVIFDGTVFSLMFFLLYLYKPYLKKKIITMC